MTKTKSKKLSGISAWPADDRPREKLLKKGARNLSNSELLVILLRTGMPGVSAIDLARDVLKKFGTFRNMTRTDTRDWKDFKGLGSAKVALSEKDGNKLWQIFLDGRNQLIESEILKTGTVNRAVVFPRKIVERALYHHAVSVIVAHNHPSGGIRTFGGR